MSASPQSTTALPAMAFTSVVILDNYDRFFARMQRPDGGQHLVNLAILQARIGVNSKLEDPVAKAQLAQDRAAFVAVCNAIRPKAMRPQV